MRAFLKHPLVDCDLEEAALWYFRRNPSGAEKLIDEARDAMRAAVEDPFRYSIVFHDIRRVRLRGFPHSVYFTAAETEVFVVAIVHGARDVKSVILGRRPSEL
jgi:plasmid stabilization system protein ParE